MGRKKYIDQIDINLLNVLKLHPSYSIAQLGEVIDLSPGPTHTRIIKLKKNRILKDDYKINYSNLGLKEKVCFFELKQSEDGKGTFNPHRIFRFFISKLELTRFILVERMELFSDEEGRSWIMLRFYPEVNERPKNRRDGKKMSYAYELDIFELFGKYLDNNEKFLHLENKKEVVPILTSSHRMKNEPHF